MSHLREFRFSESLFYIFNVNLVLSSEQEKNHYSCTDGIEKYVPGDHILSPLGKPHDANW